MLLALFAACDFEPQTIQITGTLYEGRESGVVASGASIVSMDYAFEVIDTVTTSDDGTFSVEAVAGSYLYLETQVEGGPPTGFAGQTPMSGDFVIEDGTLYGRTADEQAALEADFAGCEGLGTGATIDGEVLAYIEGVDPDDAPRVTTAYVVAYDAAGEQTEACYLADDESLIGYDAAATVTGYHGRFAIPNAPTGAVTVEIGYYLEDELAYQIFYYVYVPEEGAAPLYPAYVEVF